MHALTHTRTHKPPHNPKPNKNEQEELALWQTEAEHELEDHNEQGEGKFEFTQH